MKNKILILLCCFSIGVFAQKEQLKLSDIWNSGKFDPQWVSGLRSMNDGVSYTTIDYTDSTEEINEYAYKTGKKIKTILRSIDLSYKGKPVYFSNYSFNKDETKLLLTTDEERVYRRSRLANYFIYDLKDKTLTPLCDFSKGKQRLADFSPDGTKIAFVRNQNIFIYNLQNGKETQVTFDGKENNILNGYTDWVYEEELSFTKGFYWSPNSKYIAYYRFDESQVKQYELMYYDSLYPTVYKYKYPKAGEKNSKVSIHIYNVAQKKSILCKTDTNFEYIPRIQWANENSLCILLLNRFQNDLQFWMYSVKPDFSGCTSNLFYKELDAKYIEESYGNLTFIHDGKDFIWNDDGSRYNHLYLINVATGKNTAITSGKWDVIKFFGVDEKNGYVYYASTEKSPLEKNVYRIDLNGENKKILTPQKGYNNAHFSKGFKYFIDYHSTANTPADIALYNQNGKLIKVLQDNNALKDSLQKYATQPKEFFTVKDRDGVLLNGWMIKPTHFDPKKKYPVFMYVYGGPSSNTVTDSWGGADYLWFQYLAEHGYIVVSVDNRGTPHRSRKFKKCTYMQLGKLETEDQIDVAKYLATLPYVDGSRIGIMGWSYGGYMSSLCITKGADYFKMAIAVAPVTNWRYYDTIYTERYMRTPQENPKGYDTNAPIFYVDKLKGKYLLIHGMADDNVHFQNSVEMIKALVKANKQFDFFTYPNKNHGIYGGDTRLNLYTKMFDFIKANL